MSQPSNNESNTNRSPRLVRLLDGLTHICYGFSGIFLLLIVTMYVLEVFLRYGFNAPTIWSIDMISFTLAAMISMATPELARNNSHISIALVPESIRNPQTRDRYGRVLTFVSAFIIGYVVYVSGMETYKLFDKGILTVGTYVLPKWWVAVFIPVGLFLTAAQYLRLTVYGFGDVNKNTALLEVR